MIALVTENKTSIDVLKVYSKLVLPYFKLEFTQEKSYLYCSISACAYEWLYLNSTLCAVVFTQPDH